LKLRGLKLKERIVIDDGNVVNMATQNRHDAELPARRKRENARREYKFPLIA
jgi:hypothetical protein